MNQQLRPPNAAALHSRAAAPPAGAPSRRWHSGRRAGGALLRDPGSLQGRSKALVAAPASRLRHGPHKLPRRAATPTLRPSSRPAALVSRFCGDWGSPRLTRELTSSPLPRQTTQRGWRRHAWLSVTSEERLECAGRGNRPFTQPCRAACSAGRPSHGCPPGLDHLAALRPHQGARAPARLPVNPALPPARRYRPLQGLGRQVGSRTRACLPGRCAWKHT